MTAYHLTDSRMNYDATLRAIGRAKRSAMWLKAANASGAEYARSKRSNLALVSPETACSEFIEGAGQWSSTADAIRLAFAWMTGYHSNLKVD